jgi:hypothetical protein
MPFVDVGTTKRKKMTETRALRIWEQRKGICINCNLPINGTKDEWFIEHDRALGLGGSEEDKNLGPSHYGCKKDKDAADATRIAKAKRSKRRDLGITQALKTQPIQSKGFTPAEPQAKARKPLTKQLPPRRSLYA